MEYRPKELYQIVDQYEKEGYIEVPGYYSEKGRHCRLCGWENDSEFPKTCPKCKAQYEQDSADKQFPLNFTWLSIEDWLILQAVEHQIKMVNNLMLHLKNSRRISETGINTRDNGLPKIGPKKYKHHTATIADYISISSYV